jgi:HK97 family phage prohead protease
MTTTVERRTITRPEARLSGNGRRLSGYAAVFNSRSVDLGGFTETIAPGAFRATLARPGADVRAFFNHDPGRLLGRQGAGTLQLAEDERGLRFDLELPDTSDGRDVEELVSRRDLDGMSFSFTTIEDRWDRKGGLHERQLIAVELLEVSPVSFPAYPDTAVALRSLERFALADGQAVRRQASRRRLRIAQLRGA